MTLFVFAPFMVKYENMLDVSPLTRKPFLEIETILKVCYRIVTTEILN